MPSSFQILLYLKTRLYKRWQLLFYLRRSKARRSMRVARSRIW